MLIHINWSMRSHRPPKINSKLDTNRLKSVALWHGSYISYMWVLVVPPLLPAAVMSIARKRNKSYSPQQPRQPVLLNKSFKGKSASQHGKPNATRQRNDRATTWTIGPAVMPNQNSTVTIIPMLPRTTTTMAMTFVSRKLKWILPFYNLR